MTLMPLPLAAHLAARNAAFLAAHGAPAADHYLNSVLLERSTAYAAHVASMNLTPDVVQWALAMARKHGAYVKVWHYVADWITALLILRYGEEPDATKTDDPNFHGWPTTFTDDDTTRAGELLNGTGYPSFLSLLAKEA